MKIISKVMLPIKRLFSNKPKINKTTDYSALRKRYLSLEKGKIDKEIDTALNLGDYISALSLIEKMDRVDKKITKVVKKEKKLNEKN